MEDLKLIELPNLIDLLAEQTNKYMKMVSTGATKEEFENSQKKMKTIQKEIEFRKSKADITNSKDSN